MRISDWSTDVCSSDLSSSSESSSSYDSSSSYSDTSSSTSSDSSSSESTTTESTKLAAPNYIGIQGFYLDPDKDRGFGLSAAKPVGGVGVLFRHQGEKRFGYDLHGSAVTIENSKKLPNAIG